MCPSDPSDASVDVGRDKALIYKNGLCPRPEAALSVAADPSSTTLAPPQREPNFVIEYLMTAGFAEIRLFR
jgi:hypothetical protein